MQMESASLLASDHVSRSFKEPNFATLDRMLLSVKREHKHRPKAAFPNLGPSRCAGLQTLAGDDGSCSQKHIQRVPGLENLCCIVYVLSRYMQIEEKV